MTSVSRKTTLLLATVFLMGCAAELHRRDGMTMIQEGRLEEGLTEMAKATEASPYNAGYRKEYLAQRDAIVRQFVQSANRARQNGELDAAEEGYKRALGFDSTNTSVQSSLDSLRLEKRHQKYVEDAEAAFKAGNAERALELLRVPLIEGPDNQAALKLKSEIDGFLSKSELVAPGLQKSYSRPINLEFRDANVKMVFESLSRTTGINFILDKDVRPDLRTTVYLRNSSIDDALDLIAQTSQLQRKVLNGNTVLIYPGTQEKIKEYQDLVVRGFYLKNTDAKTMQNNLKLLFKGRDMVIDEKLNLIVMRDTPEAVRLVERVIAMHDIPEAEVMLELEVLEVQRSRLTALGVQWPSQMTFAPLSTGGALTVDDLRDLNSSTIRVGVGNTVVNARRNVTDVDILANPRIRVRNKEKAKIMIGDKLPVVTTTTTATGLVSDNIQYLDVGLKVDVEPEVRVKNDVQLKLALEVSSVVNQITTPSGSLAYQVGTRNANTSLLLKDGETQILAGLISAQERSTGNRLPGLGDVPIVGRLFGSQQDENSKTEIVLLITPRVVRGLKRPEIQQTEFWSGTESNLRTRPMTFQSHDTNGNPGQSKVEQQPAAPGPAAGILANAVQTELAARNVQLSWQGPVTAKVGDEFKVALRVKADGTIKSLPIQLAYDPRALQIIDVAEGSFFSQNSGATSFSKNIDAAGGKVFVSVARSDLIGASGEGEVLFLNVRALSQLDNSVLKVLQASAITQSESQPSIVMPPAWGVARSK